jgi:hypothetical protein
MKPRVTVSLQPDGGFDIWINEAGRDLLIKELQGLSERWDHFHLDHYGDPEIADATDVALSAVPYEPSDRVLLNGKVLFRSDHWDREHFPHVGDGAGAAAESITEAATTTAKRIITKSSRLPISRSHSPFFFHECQRMVVAAKRDGLSPSAKGIE